MNFKILKDEWLTNVLKKNCYNLNIKGPIKKKSIKFPRGFITCKLKSTEYLESIYLQEHNFRCIDYPIKFSIDGQSKLDSKNCRFFERSDLESVLDLSKFIKNSRFHLDKNIKKEAASLVKYKWIESFFMGKRGDGLIVYEFKKKIRGLLLYILKKGEAIIDLIVVHPLFRKKKVASEMIGYLLRNKKFKILSATTQASNIGAQIFYNKLGFKFINSSIVLHRNDP